MKVLHIFGKFKQGWGNGALHGPRFSLSLQKKIDLRLASPRHEELAFLLRHKTFNASWLQNSGYTEFGQFFIL